MYFFLIKYLCMIIKTYFIALVVFFLIDIIWLSLVAKKFYAEQIGFLMKDKPNWIAAFLFYALFIFGIVYFVIELAIGKGSWEYALLSGSFFGLISYATYDLTNLATLKKWPLKVTIVDMVWGTVLTGSVSLITYLISSWL